MTVTAPARRNRRHSVRAGWGYASGRIAVLETMLLPRSFFEGLIASKNMSDARGALAKTPYRAAFGTEQAIRGHGVSLDAFTAAWRGAIFGDCPWHVFKSAWALPERYRAVRTAFLRKSGKGALGEELAQLLDGLAPTSHEAKVLATHRRLALAGKFAGDAVAASLLLDSAACTLMWAQAALAAQEKVAAVLTDRAALAAWSSVLRARWNGTTDETIRRWFVLPEARQLVEAAAAAPDDEAPAALAGFASKPTVDFLRGLDGRRLRQDLERAMGEAVRETVLACRRVAFGPERVLSYLVAYDTEESNIRIALAAVVENLDKAGAIARLRREYV